jgi:translation initiation factor IF-3
LPPHPNSYSRRPVEPQHIKNEFIRFPELRLIDENGEQFGVVPTSVALKKAQDLELDLVVIAPTANPPVAKIVDYGQFLYQKQKEEQKNKAKQKKTDLKVLKVSFKTGEHDKQRMLDKAIDFITGGDKVRFEMQLRGREKSKKPLAIEMMNALLQKVASSAKVEQPVTALDNVVVFTLTSKK